MLINKRGHVDKHTNGKHAETGTHLSAAPTFAKHRVNPKKCDKFLESPCLCNTKAGECREVIFM